MDRLLYFIGILLISFFIHCESKYSESLKVVLSHGGGVYGHYTYSKSGRGIKVFRGIPYAEPPIGNLRFANPIEKKGWAGFIDGDKNKIVCPQTDILVNKYVYQGQEDCLYLNVFVPHISEKQSELLPVMFFIHGSVFSPASGDIYGPEYLLDHDVILVTANYRLGALGFLSMGNNELSGNYGLRDQVMILKWIQTNIHSFGGDPNKVTLFGHSDGSAFVSMHMSSPLSKGLFHQGILQSGTMYSNWAIIDSNIALNNSKKLFEFLSCPFGQGNFINEIACLRGKTPQQIEEQTSKFSVFGTEFTRPFRPVLEASTVLSPFLNPEIFTTGPDPAIPVIIGLTAQEGAIKAATIGSNPNLIKSLEANFDQSLPFLFHYSHFTEAVKSDWTQQIKMFYFQNRPFNWNVDKTTFVDLITEGGMLTGINQFLTKRFASGQAQNTFVYFFNYRGEASMADLLQSDNSIDYGVCHGDDLLYLFSMSNQVSSVIPNENDNNYRMKIGKMWTDFAHFGQPFHVQKPSPEKEKSKSSKSSKSKKSKEPIKEKEHESPWKAATGFPLDYLRFEVIQPTLIPTKPPKNSKDKKNKKDKKQKEVKEVKEPQIEFMGMDAGLLPQQSEFWNQLYNYLITEVPKKDEL